MPLDKALQALTYESEEEFMRLKRVLVRDQRFAWLRDLLERDLKRQVDAFKGKTPSVEEKAKAEYETKLLVKLRNQEELSASDKLLIKDLAEAVHYQTDTIYEHLSYEPHRLRIFGGEK